MLFHGLLISRLGVCKPLLHKDTKMTGNNIFGLSGLGERAAMRGSGCVCNAREFFQVFWTQFSSLEKDAATVLSWKFLGDFLLQSETMRSN